MDQGKLAALLSDLHGMAGGHLEGRNVDHAVVHRDEIESAYDNPADNSLQDKVLEYAIGLTEIADPLIKEDINVNVEKVGRYFSTVSIEVTYPYKPITPGIKELFGSSDGIDLIVQSKMQVTPGSK